MDKRIKKIIIKAFEGSSDKISVKRIKGNYRNRLYTLNNSSILKVFTGDKAYEHFSNELEFVNRNRARVHLPKMEMHAGSNEDVYYIIYEKIVGACLSGVWDDLTDDVRQNMIELLMRDLKEIHQQEEESYGWASYIMSKIESSLEQIEMDECFKSKEVTYIKDAVRKIPKFLSENPKFVRIHNRIDFDNIYFDLHNCVLIDYEDSFVAPIDYEVARLLRFSAYPKSYVSKMARVANYADIKDWVFEYYPEIAEIENIEERLAIYDLEAYLEELANSSVPEKKRKIAKRAIKSALIINKYSSLNFESIKNESELMQFMEMFISYGWLDDNVKTRKPIDKKKYHTMSLSDTIKYDVGTSIEQANMAACKFTDLGFESKVFVLKNKDDRVYAFCLFSYNDLWYYFEHANKKLKGVKSYDTLEDAVAMTDYLLQNELKMYESFCVETGVIPANLSYSELLKYIDTCASKENVN